MICKNCGAEIANGTKFCQNCGAAVQPEAVSSAPAANGPGLVWGILGLAFGSSIFLSLLGLIFSAIGNSKARKFVKQGNPLVGKDKAGKILSTIGLIISIFGIVLFVIYVLAIAAYIAQGL